MMAPPPEGDDSPARQYDHREGSRSRDGCCGRPSCAHRPAADAKAADPSGGDHDGGGNSGEPPGAVSADGIGHECDNGTSSSDEEASHSPD